MLPRTPGIPRHSVGYSLGFEGKTEKLPNSQVLMLSTMCGHGMVSASLAKKMIDCVKETGGRLKRRPRCSRVSARAACSIRRGRSEFSKMRATGPRSAPVRVRRPRFVAGMAAAWGPRCCCGGLHTGGAAGASTGRSALTNFTLIDGTDREPVPGSAMVIGEDGKIQWVGRPPICRSSPLRRRWTWPAPTSCPVSSTCMATSGTRLNSRRSRRTTRQIR